MHLLTRLAILGMGAVLLLGMAGCDDSRHQAKQRNKTTLVEVASVSHAPISITRIVTGTLEAASQVQIFNEEQGRIIALPFYEGDQVKQGDVLARIDDSIIQSELNKAKATLKKARQDLKRVKRLFARKLTSDEELSRTTTLVEQADAEVELLQNRFNRTRIKAPFDGIISTRLRESGDVVPLYTHILTLYDPSFLKADIRLSELLLSGIDNQHPVTVRIDALGEQSFKGEVTRIHPTIDPVTRQGTLEIKLQPVPEGARPGQLCRVKISTKSTPRLTIPFAALRHDNLGEFVYQVDETNKIHKVRVQSGIQLGDRVEVIEGLQQAQTIVARGFIGLRDGAMVTIKNNTAISSPAQPRQAETK